MKVGGAEPYCPATRALRPGFTSCSLPSSITQARLRCTGCSPSPTAPSTPVCPSSGREGPSERSCARYSDKAETGEKCSPGRPPGDTSNIVYVFNPLRDALR